MHLEVSHAQAVRGGEAQHHGPRAVRARAEVVAPRVREERARERGHLRTDRHTPTTVTRRSTPPPARAREERAARRERDDLGRRFEMTSVWRVRSGRLDHERVTVVCARNARRASATTLVAVRDGSFWGSFRVHRTTEDH